MLLAGMQAGRLEGRLERLLHMGVMVLSLMNATCRIDKTLGRPPPIESMGQNTPRSGVHGVSLTGLHVFGGESIRLASPCIVPGQPHGR